MNYVRIQSPNSAFDNMVGEVTQWDAGREIVWVAINPMAVPIQFRPRELDEIGEREFLTEQAAWALGVRL